MSAKMKELKDSVVETLESKGVLGKMRVRYVTFLLFLSLKA